MRNPECGTLYDCHGGVVTKDTHEYMNKSHLNKYYARHTNWSPDDIVAKTHSVLGIQGPIVPSSSIHGRADTSPSHLNTDSGEQGKSHAENRSWWESLGGAFAGAAKGVWHGVTATGRFLKNHWRGLVETAGFGVCVFMSLGACAVAGGLVLAAKFGADWYTHDVGYAAKNGLVGLKDYTIGLAIGGAGGAAMKAGWRTFAKSTGKGIAPLTARHALGRGRHRALPSRGASWLMYGGNVPLGQVGCGTTFHAPGYC